MITIPNTPSAAWVAPGLKKDTGHYISVIKPHEEITDAVSHYTGISIEKIKGTRGTQEIAYARHLVAYFLREYTNMTLQNISRYLNRMDHTTSAFAHKKIMGLVTMKHDNRTKFDVKQIEGLLNGVTINDYRRINKENA